MKRLLAIGALACAITGCGTVRNFQREASENDRASVYGGVKIAAEGFTPSSESAAVWLRVLWPLVAADVAFSAVGDTLTLPVTGTLEACPAVRRLCYIAFFYNDNPPPQQHAWREFWFKDMPPAPESPPAP